MSWLNLQNLGGIVTFSGVVRPMDSLDRELSHIDYEAYPSMVEKSLQKLCEEVKARWNVEQIAILHRVGRVATGEPSVIIIAAAAHRKEAFRACEYAIDTLKEIVPIWKKEMLKEREFSSSALSPSGAE